MAQFNYYQISECNISCLLIDIKEKLNKKTLQKNVSFLQLCNTISLLVEYDSLTDFDKKNVDCIYNKLFELGFYNKK